MNDTGLDAVISRKMRQEGVSEPVIAGFLRAVHKVQAGDTGLLPESTIEAVTSLPGLDDLPASNQSHQSLLQQLAVIKLNGGLGTGMGLDRAKSLMLVKDQETFLDFIARQIYHLRGEKPFPAFFLMNSFSTREDTLEYLKKYPALNGDGPLDFLQSKVPKLGATSLEPVSWPKDPELEWCPPGHGDIYPSLLACGLLEKLLSQGIKYLFVSNSDNLGATVDLSILGHFAQTGESFLMEVAERTAADRKGGHLARRKSDGRLLLRESAQCPKAEEAQFQDIERHQFFNTNNLWIRLDHLKTALQESGGALSLPLITNSKTIDPRDPASPKVLQLESAMGAAIECFPQTGALVVPRTRFAPVKTTADLLALRSDAYRVTDDLRLVLDESRKGQPPVIELDGRYKMIADFEKCFPQGVPSLVRCDHIKITGPMVFEGGVVCEGRVEFSNMASETRRVPAGRYADDRVAL
jgi:UDP-N-acetylglucosamine pyrophosphorylase